MNYSERKTQYKSRRLASKSVRRLRHVGLWILRIFILAIFIGVGAVGYKTSKFISEAISETPDIQSIDIVGQGEPTRILDLSGNPVYELSMEDLNRKYVSIEQIPDSLKNAVTILQEQESLSISEQFLFNQVNYDSDAKGTIGSVKKTIQEKYMANELENLYTSDEILEYYLNTITFGRRTIGIGAAAERYFNKDVNSLTLSECALLAGIIKNPTAYEPINHASRCRNRQLAVLASLQESGNITSEEYEQAIEDDVFSRVQRYNRIFTESQPQMNYFCDALIASVTDDMKSRLGYSETKAVNTLYKGGLTIYCTLDTDMQNICDEEVGNSANYSSDVMYQLNYQLTITHPDGTQVAYSFSDMKKWYEEPTGEGADEVSPVKNLSQYYTSTKKPLELISIFRRAVLDKSDTVVAESIELIPQPQVSLVILDTSTGAVKALVGGRDDTIGANRGIDTLRQPGTEMSVLSTYVPAVDTIGLTLGTIINDEEYYYPGTEEPVLDRFEFYQGLCTMRKSMAESINVNAVKTLDQVTPKIGYDYLKNLGFSSLVDGYSAESGLTDTDISLSLALGNLRRGVSNLELTAAYSTIAGGGVYRKPYYYTSIITPAGEELLGKNESANKRVMKDSTAWLITDAIRVNQPDGESRYPNISFGDSEMAIAGVSGESENNNDAWFVGYTPYLAAGVWGGYDGGRSQTNTEYTQKIWNEVMRRIHDGYEVKPTFSAPGDILSATICTKCGKLAIEGLCEDAVGGEAQSIEYYTSQTVPTDTCDCHVRVRICKESGHLAGDACPEEDIYELVYLQKKDETAGEGKTVDSSLIMPDYLIDSTCEVHGG